MHMENTIEIGWIVTTKNDDEYQSPEKLFPAIAADFPTAEREGYFVPDTQDHPEGFHPDALALETHPHDEKRVYVSVDTPGHGWDSFAEPKALGKVVRDFIAKYDPEAVVTWALIETRR